MNAIDPLHPIQSAILEVLAEKPGIPVAALHKALKKDPASRISLPNLYRTVGLMTDAHILVKEKGNVSLNRIWIPHLLSFAESVRQTYMESSAEIRVSPLKEKERREYTADSLAGLDAIWFHLLVSYGNASRAKVWYAYNSHPWHVLGTPHTELRGYESMGKSGMTSYMLYGNDTFLDRYGVKLVKIPKFHVHINIDCPFPKDEYLLWVCDDIIIDCILPPVIAERLSYFFKTVTSIKEFDVQLFSDIFQMKVPCKITLRRDKKEAEKLKGVIKRCLK